MEAATETRVDGDEVAGVERKRKRIARATEAAVEFQTIASGGDIDVGIVYTLVLDGQRAGARSAEGRAGGCRRRS